jgi:hypothetical protein
LRTHACYAKYYYRERLMILRCICRNCRVTHAVIPSFSLPGTSIGTAEAEEYIRRRERGEGRGKASKVFSGDKAMSRNHPVVLERAFRRAVARAKAIFGGAAAVDNRLQGTAWIEALTGKSAQPILSLNQYCLEHRLNCICLTRFPIHLFREKRGRIRSPHKNGSPQRRKEAIYSCSFHTQGGTG